MAEIVNLDALIPREDFIAPIDNSGSPGAGGKESEAVDLAFGPYAKFGTIVKDYRNASMPYTPSEMVGTKRTAKRNIGEHEVRTICTSHIERHNLTIRTFMKRFTRLALGFSKKLENLESAVALHLAYYNFCWRPGKTRITPAMAAGVTPSLWTFNDLMNA